jgi:hypothetical protein
MRSPTGEGSLQGDTGPGRDFARDPRSQSSMPAKLCPALKFMTQNWSYHCELLIRAWMVPDPFGTNTR